jgi:hypothetical protein
MDAMKFYPNEKLLYYNLGTVYAEEEMLKEALENFDKAVKLDPLFDKARAGKKRVEKLIAASAPPVTSPPNDVPQDTSK